MPMCVLVIKHVVKGDEQDLHYLQSK